MSWGFVLTAITILGLSLFATASRRGELLRMQRQVRARETAARAGDRAARLQQPHIDLSRCLGCGKCVEVCPEDDVLGMVHGQAAVIHGARCVGVAACARVCPVDAITVTIADLAERDDVPVLTDELESVTAPGVFLAGEVTAHALIKTAVEHGTAVADRVAARRARNAEAGLRDLCIVGAGPAGLACALQARAHGLSFVWLEQESAAGGTVAKYPRQKLVLTESVALPLHGRLPQRSYEKEELVALWSELVDSHELPLRCDAVVEAVERDADGSLRVRGNSAEVRARAVCLAIGRRGTPARLDVPGEDASSVAYGLLDAQSLRDRALLVVGGGDSAAETAIALAEQPGNRVHLAYRKPHFYRMRRANEQRLHDLAQRGRLRLLMSTEIRGITEDHVELERRTAEGIRRGRLAVHRVFAMLGGTPPAALLAAAGVSCNPELRPPPAAAQPRGAGIRNAAITAAALLALATAWVLWHVDYYGLATAERPTHDLHEWLRPGRGAGLAFGIAAVALIATNLAYLARRTERFHLRLGSLRLWMTSHVATGVLALLCAVLHAALAPRDTPGGHALWALLALVVSGAIGRYFYAWLPRAANGRELRLDEVKAELESSSEDWSTAAVDLRRSARRAVEESVERHRWRAGFAGRAFGLLTAQRSLRRTISGLRHEGTQHGVAPPEIARTIDLTRRAHHLAVTAAHFEDVRALLSTWRWLHRWVAVLMLLLLAVHVFYALAYGAGDAAAPLGAGAER